MPLSSATGELRAEEGHPGERDAHALAAARRALGPEGQPAVRLGFRLVDGLSSAGIGALLAARERAPFRDVEDLIARSGIGTRDRRALVDAGALANLTGDRHRAQWAVLGAEELPGMLRGTSAEEPPLQLELPTEGEDIVADYRSLGLTLGRHPLALLRARLAARRIIESRSWKGVPDGRPARLAGLVRMRQRPGSARGTMFLTLEDEGGPINVILWPGVVERYRREVLGSRMLVVDGTTQRESGVTHLVAGRCEDLSWMLGELDGPRSRDFH